jgi:hypothetical protein
MDEAVNDIVAILTENGVQTRRERAAFVARLRDELGLTFEQIGRQLNVSNQRASQLYRLHGFLGRRAPIFNNLSTRAYRFIEMVASVNKFPEDWQAQPGYVDKLFAILRQMTRQEALRYRHIGQHTMPEIEELLASRGLRFYEAFSLDGEDDADLVNGPSEPETVMREISQALEEAGAKGEFRLWPKGTYKGPYVENADFVMTLSDILADAFEEGWGVANKVTQIAESHHYHHEMGTRYVVAFYADTGPHYSTL